MSKEFLLHKSKACMSRNNIYVVTCFPLRGEIVASLCRIRHLV